MILPHSSKYRNSWVQTYMSNVQRLGKGPVPDPNRDPMGPRFAVQVHLVIPETSGAQSAIGGLCSHGLPKCDLGPLGGSVQQCGG